MSAAYYAKGMEIWKSPVTTDNGDGTTSISIGFQCATATEIVGEEGAQAIAEMLTLTADSADLTAEAAARIAALEAENERLRTEHKSTLDVAGCFEEWQLATLPAWARAAIEIAARNARAALEAKP